jgi:hypothetical protein
VDVIPLLAYNYNTSIQKTTRKSPFEIHFPDGQIGPAPDASVIPTVFPTEEQIQAERAAIPHFDPYDDSAVVLRAQDIQRLENLPVPNGIAIPPLVHRAADLQAAGYTRQLTPLQMDAKMRIFKHRNDVLEKQHKKISIPAVRAKFPPGTKVYIDQLALRQKGLQEYEFRRQVKAFLIPKWTAAIYTVAEVNGQTGRVVLAEPRFHGYSFYPYQLKPAKEPLVKHATAGTCDWQRPRRPRPPGPPGPPNPPQDGNRNVNHPPPVQPQGNPNNRRPIAQHFTRSQRGAAGNPFDSNRSESQLYRIAADVGRRNARLKPKDTKLGAVEEFQLENELFDRIRDIRDAFNDLFFQAVTHNNFKEYVEYTVYVLYTGI